MLAKKVLFFSFSLFGGSSWHSLSPTAPFAVSPFGVQKFSISHMEAHGDNGQKVAHSNYTENHDVECKLCVWVGSTTVVFVAACYYSLYGDS